MLRIAFICMAVFHLIGNDRYQLVKPYQAPTVAFSDFLDRSLPIKHSNACLINENLYQLAFPRCNQRWGNAVVYPAIPAYQIGC